MKVNFPQTTKDASRNDRYKNERAAPRERREGEGYSPRPGGSFNSAMKIFVGNLSWGVDDVALDELFSEYGKVVEAKVVHDKATGRSRGFGFVTMTKETEVASAIEALDGAVSFRSKSSLPFRLSGVWVESHDCSAHLS